MGLRPSPGLPPMVPRIPEIDLIKATELRDSIENSLKQANNKAISDAKDKKVKLAEKKSKKEPQTVEENV